MNDPIFLFAESYMGCAIRYFWDERAEQYLFDVRGRYYAGGPLNGPVDFGRDFVRRRMSFLARLGMLISLTERWNPVTKTAKRRSP